MDETRQSSQHFLELIKRSHRGKFKIYIGMSAGVGKTYRMLQEAHQLLDAGVDVRIGYIETHGRAETEALVAGLPLVPRRKLFYKGKELEEMDTQGIINLHPEIVVINYGTNDIALNAGTYDEDATFGNIRSMVDLARANGIGVVLASCLPAEGFSWRPAVTDAMDSIRSLNARVRAFAEAEGIPYADYFSALVNEEGTAMDSRYADEHPAVHPNTAGYAVMETILLDAVDRARKAKQ